MYIGMHSLLSSMIQIRIDKIIYQNSQLQSILLGRDTCNPTFVIHNSDKSLCTLSYTQSRINLVFLINKHARLLYIAIPVNTCTCTY